MTERLVRAAGLDTRRDNLNAGLDALPTHPWATREEETWQQGTAGADTTASRRIVIDTLRQPRSIEELTRLTLQNGAEPT